MSHFGDLIGVSSPKPTPTIVETKPPMVDENPPRPEEDIAEILSEETTDEIDLNLLSKIELEEYGRTIGIELDRRHNKKKLVKQLEDELKKQE